MKRRDNVENAVRNANCEAPDAMRARIWNNVSDPHRQQWHQRILRRIVERQRASGRHRYWQITAALAALICIAGVVGAFVIARYHTVGQGSIGASQFVGEDREPTHALNSSDTNSVMAVGQTAGNLRDMDAARQKDGTELVQVIESEVNGRLASRMLIPKRQLSSNQMKSLREGDPEIRVQKLLVTLPAAARTEMSQLRRAGKGENLGTQERQMKGRVFLFKRERYTLHDGTTVTLSVGEPKDMRQPLPPVPEGNQP